MKKVSSVVIKAGAVATAVPVVGMLTAAAASAQEITFCTTPSQQTLCVNLAVCAQASGVV